MNTVLAILVAGFAAFLWLFLFRILDFFRPEKWSRLLLFFFLGGLSVLIPVFLPVYIGEGQDELGILKHHLFQVALVEELSKILPLIVFLLVRPRFFTDQPDYLVCAAASGLGFGFVENVLYALEGGVFLLHFRDIVNMVFHAFLSGIAAYGLMRIIRKEIVMGILWILFGICLHALFNFGVDERNTESSAIILYLISYGVFLISIECFALMMNNAVNESRFFSETVAMPSRAIRVSMTLGFGLLFAVFMVLETIELGAAGIGIFLFLSSPLLVVLYIAINRLCSLILIRGKVFKVVPTSPIFYGGISLNPQNPSPMSFQVKGIPYDETAFVSKMNTRFRVRPISLAYDYFGSYADLRMTDKVYGKSQVIFYKVEVEDSEDPVEQDMHYYLVPKLNGVKEKNGQLIVALISREEPIDSQTEDIGLGPFCAWVYLEVPPHLGAIATFFHLLREKGDGYREDPSIPGRASIPADRSRDL